MSYFVAQHGVSQNDWHLLRLSPTVVCTPVPSHVFKKKIELYALGKISHSEESNDDIDIASIFRTSCSFSGWMNYAIVRLRPTARYIASFDTNEKRAITDSIIMLPHGVTNLKVAPMTQHQQPRLRGT
jgi:hypothetical protein